jgi:hypothetical protein
LIENWETGADSYLLLLRKAQRERGVFSVIMTDMAQHRTKRDKINAQIHRLENIKLYSLSELDSAPVSKRSPEVESSKRNSVASSKQPNSQQSIDLHYVKIDLQRTFLSFVLVLALLPDD